MVFKRARFVLGLGIMRKLSACPRVDHAQTQTRKIPTAARVTMLKPCCAVVAPQRLSMVGNGRPAAARNLA